MSDRDALEAARRATGRTTTSSADRERPGRSSASRDMTPALGSHGAPGAYERAVEGAPVALHLGHWRDGAWSYLYGSDTSYAPERAVDGQVIAANRRARSGPLRGEVQGPVINQPVWTWEVPLYFWLGGVASGAGFAALACDLAGDHRSAVIARRVALGALVPSPPLLIMDLGRPERFYNMLRVFKPRSPMNMGAWALTLFGNLAGLGVAADLLGRRRVARALGGANAVVGGYLGSYAGVLLACTAVPVWARSRAFLGPLFVATATATGAAATRLTLSAAGLPARHPTARALARVQAGAMGAELALSVVNERRLGRLGRPLDEGVSGRLFRAARVGVGTGLALQAAARWAGPGVQHAASATYLAAGLAFRYAWVNAGKPSAQDDEAVARMHREEQVGDEPAAPVVVEPAV